MKYQIETPSFGSTVIKKKKEKIPALNYNAFLELKEQPKIIGYSTLKKQASENEHSNLLSYNNIDYNITIKSIDKARRFRKYLLVGNNQAVEYRTFPWIPFMILMIIIMAVIIGACTLGKLPVEKVPGFQTGGNSINNTYTQPDRKKDNITISGVQNITLHDKEKNIKLPNVETNTVYQKFTVYFQNEEIAQSVFIEPNKQAELNLYDKLPAGKNTVTIFVENIDIETKRACNSAKFTTQITVIK